MEVTTNGIRIGQSWDDVCERSAVTEGGILWWSSLRQPPSTASACGCVSRARETKSGTSDQPLPSSGASLPCKPAFRASSGRQLKQQGTSGGEITETLVDGVRITAPFQGIQYWYHGHVVHDISLNHSHRENHSENYRSADGKTNIGPVNLLNIIMFKSGKSNQIYPWSSKSWNFLQWLELLCYQNWNDRHITFVSIISF